MAALSIEMAREICELLAHGGRAALATVTRTGGSTPQVAGARLLRYADGRTSGTVGGGRIEQVVLEELARCQREGTSRTVSWDLTRDLGMCCGGRMEVFVELLESKERLILFGAGHVARATAALAAQAGFAPCVVDERDELNTEDRFVGMQRCVADPVEALRVLEPSARDFVLIVTHDHQLDERALEAALARPHRYIGMIGSRRKVLSIVARIEARRGLLDLSRVYAPVGLPIRAEGPDEIAVSIVAELISVRRGAQVPHLRLVGASEGTQQA